MSAAPIILSTPQGAGKAVDAEALRLQYGCTHVVDDWHPRMSLQPGGLHLTNIHPGDLEDWGIDANAIKLHGWARKATQPMAPAQAGHIFTPLLGLLLSLFGAILLAFILASSFHLDALTISDHSAEVAVAQDLEQAQREEVRRSRLHGVYRAVCGNAEWEELGSGAILCLPRRGHKPYAVQLAEVQP